jgi:4,4'-diaponeurosporenoate glycosyltransferase
MLFALTLLLGSLGFVLLWRLPRLKSPAPLPTLRRLSIIIPARNEAANLPRLLRSLADQLPADTEVIVADDGSSDDTAQLARGLGATVIHVPPKPMEWIGKTWACHHGVIHSRGEWLLFLDADTWFEPGGMDRLLGHFASTNCQALSVAPYHRLHRLHEELSAFFNLITVAATGNVMVGRRQQPPDGAFGPVLLMERQAYEAVGGYASVRNRILENFSLAKRLMQAGMKVSNAVGRESISYRMYPEGIHELLRGWSKGFAAGAGQTPARTMLPLIAWFSGLMMAVQPAKWLDPATLPWWGGLYLAMTLQVWFHLRRVGNFGFLTALLYPVPLGFYFLLFTWALIQGKRGKSPQWKGRPVNAP